MIIYSLTYSFPNLEPVYSSMSSSNCCFLTCLQISQEICQVIWNHHLFKNFPKFVVIYTQLVVISSVQFSSVAQLCPTLCDPMNHSTTGLPVHHHLPEFTQTHVHQVCDAIQPSHPRSSPSPPAPNPSQHQTLFQ